MPTSRLEAFSDGVLAIIITIMVLELKVPGGEEWSDLKPLAHRFISYVFSFIYVGIYWNNHHNLFSVIENVNGKILWINLLLLFCLSLLPVTTAWLGDSDFRNDHAALLYGVVLLMSALAYFLLEYTAIKSEGSDSKISKAIKSYAKEKISIMLYLIGIVLSSFYPIAAIIIYYIVAFVWFIPDKRIANLHL